MISGGERLVTSIAKVPLLVSPLAQATDNDPMRGLQARARRRGQDVGMERVCVVGGFAYSDVARAGMSVLAVHSQERSDDAYRVLAETARDIEAQAGRFSLSREGAGDAVRRALASPRRPVVLVDVADNVGGGSPGDGTELLRELIDQGARGSLVVIADPEAASSAASVGAGGEFSGLVGAKADVRHGQPLALRGTVTRIGDGRYRAEGTWMTGRSFEMGTTAVLEVNGNTVVLTERRVPPFHAEQVTSQGIDPASMNFIVVKGAIAWRAAFGDVAGEVIEVATPGVCPVDPAVLGRTTVPTRYP
jgi:microcystin degradation protein MlrC